MLNIKEKSVIKRVFGNVLSDENLPPFNSFKSLKTDRCEAQRNGNFGATFSFGTPAEINKNEGININDNGSIELSFKDEIPHKEIEIGNFSVKENRRPNNDSISSNDSNQIPILNRTAAFLTLAKEPIKQLNQEQVAKRRVCRQDHSESNPGLCKVDPISFSPKRNDNRKFQSVIKSVNTSIDKNQSSVPIIMNLKVKLAKRKIGRAHV